MARRRRESGGEAEAERGDIRGVLERSAELIDGVCTACAEAVAEIDERLDQARGEESAEGSAEPTGYERDVLALIEVVSTRTHGLEQEAGELAEVLQGAAGLLSAPGQAGHEEWHDEESPRVSEGARVLALQMAAAGSSRGEIEDRLHESFGIMPEALTEVLGEKEDS